MWVQEHPQYGRLLNSMRTIVLRVRSWSGIVYRSAPPKWSRGRDMLSGLGSMKAGARFNAPGSFPAVYASTTPEPAMVETLAYQRRAGLPVEHALPLVFKAMFVEVERLLDLTDTAALLEAGVATDELRDDAWWLSRSRHQESFTQAIGRAAHACGVQALRVVSAHTPSLGENLVVLPGNIRPPSFLKVLRRPRRS